MIGIRSAISIRARGHWPHLEAVYMTAPRSFRRKPKKPLPRGGRPYMTKIGIRCCSSLVQKIQRQAGPSPVHCDQFALAGQRDVRCLQLGTPKAMLVGE